ncbi:MAG: hypothetical protein JWO97_166 [Acidobacteria bacterium]|nr:hypothetical protein [Acidobacteriota bacterium]
MLRRLNGRGCCRGFCTTTGSAATAATTISAARLLLTRGLLLLLLRRFLRGRTLIALLMTLFAAFTRLLRFLAAHLLRASFRTRRACFRGDAAGALIELLQFLLHELAALRLEFRAQRIVAAVRAALPSVRM